jgi:hypothetical protein
MSFKEQFNQQLNNMISGTNEKKKDRHNLMSREKYVQTLNEVKLATC